MLVTACDGQNRDRTEAMQALELRKGELADRFQECPRTSTTLLPAIVAESRCLVFEVPENPAEPSGRQVALQVMVVPAIRALAEPDPLVILVGGPGQAATVDGLQVLPAFERVRRNRDILLVDQRGTGSLSPFDCYFGEDDEALEGNAELLLETQNRYLQQCLDSVDAAPQFYTTDIAVQDLDAIRAWLGYRELNLWGISYGTRVALAYLKYFPDQTRTVVLDGVAPPGVLPLGAARDGYRAMQQILDLCAAEPACAEAFPRLREHYAALRERHRAGTPVSLRDPVDGSLDEVDVSTSTIESLMFQMLYSREATRLIPLFIEELYRGNFQVLTWPRGSTAAINIGMHYSVICSEDLPLVSAADLREAATDETVFVYDLLVQPRVEGCRIWPSRMLDPAFFEPVVSNKPVLIFSATQDPVTPSRLGDQVAQTLGNARHVVAEGVGHGVFAYGCATVLIGEFVETADVQALDASCMDTLDTRPFFITWGGSAAGDD